LNWAEKGPNLGLGVFGGLMLADSESGLNACDDSQAGDPSLREWRD
jgi:hypothetical protein